MKRQDVWLAVALFLFVAAWGVAVLGAPHGEMGRVLFSAALAVAGVLSMAKSGRLG